MTDCKHGYDPIRCYICKDERIANLEEENKHNARQLGIANTKLKQAEISRIESEGLITHLESTISGYEAVMKAKELLDEQRG